MFDQTHIMTGLLVEGADAQEFLGRLSCNRLHKSTPGSASQLICVNKEGRLIGDVIAFFQGNGSFRLYAGTCINWIHYNLLAELAYPHPKPPVPGNQYPDHKGEE